MERRLNQIHHIKDTHAKYNGYMSTIYQSFIGKNFTEYGWALTKAPQHIVDDLRRSFHEGLVSNPITETISVAIDSDDLPLFIENNHLNHRVMHELLPIHEAWAGVKLVPNNAYGLRVYRKGSTLNMHLDKTETHIISSILHVDHDPMSDPWPLVIEDFHGNLHEVSLESGDMLLYESSKCTHGRPRKFNGSWYTSVFTHYYPTDWDAQKTNLETHFRVPPGWNYVPEHPDPNLDKLVVIGTSVKEPDCEHQWCALKNSTKWYAAAPPYGQIVSADGQVKDLKNIPMEKIISDEL
eukprot:CAMPEP_0197823968 /NCGR_PEP_ID=MMETSP1437-20131217/1285_1 /TAXON_ID=49252 ORGANISM="Eucampia antarctica, Strain CCMP1452" /NCGR_SAMPLE_ID=MMETSP1437 /ASSEMBLY_ACC=CAM_ASM_001096 /LENGTH=294 /DNA_ID=CAMNT_0043423407 /DNA_START=211 /DNA_END=1095 /DNA_ORIENTATION=+